MHDRGAGGDDDRRADERPGIGGVTENHAVEYRRPDDAEERDRLHRGDVEQPERPGDQEVTERSEESGAER
jgi:hypothetical protein